MQLTLEANIEKRAKGLYGPPAGKRLIMFIDDMNMPEPDSYGTQQPIALLKLLFTNGGFYDRDRDLKWRRICDLNYIGAMGTPGGGRNAVDPRFLSQFSIYQVNPPGEKTLLSVFTKILDGYIGDTFSEEVVQTVPTVTQSMLNVYR